MDRRSFLWATVVGAGAYALDPFVFPRALQAACSASGPYGALRAADVNGIKLPMGFASRVVARSGSRVGTSAYTWHQAPDGGATFPLRDGGWVYVSNSEVSSGGGGAGSIRFDSGARIVGATRILSRTSRNCAGGATPWGTWLSCEEVDRGYVWECHPLNQTTPVRRSALGRFKHEAAAVDGTRKVVYLTEDETDGRFYRFRYTNPSDLSRGTLEVARVSNGSVSWSPVPDPSAATTRTRYQVAGSTAFNGGEGVWYGNGVVHFTTKGGNRVWAYDVVARTIKVIYAPATSCNPVLTGVDNVTVSRSGDVYVAEDGGNMQLVILGPNGSVSPFLEITGQSGSEITGPAFSPKGDRLYLSSQRGALGNGVTYEVRGPFRATV